MKIQTLAPLMALLSPAVAWASLPPLTWEQAVELAARDNAELQAAQASLRAAEESLSGSRNTFLPQLSGNLGYSYGNSSTSVFSSNPTTNTTSLSGGASNARGSYTANLSASQNLFNGFQDRARIDQAKANVELAKAALQTTKAKVSADLKNAFEGVVYSTELGKLSRDIIRRRADNLRMVELRFESGRENKGSVLLSKAYLKQAEFESLTAGNDLAIARAQLARAIGLDEESGLESREVRGEVPAQAPPASPPDFKAIAVATPDHAQAVARESDAEAAVTIARSGFFPSLNLTGTVGRQGTPATATQTDRWSVGVGISFPLFSGGKDWYATRSSLASLEAAARNSVNVDRQLLTTLRNAFTQYTEAAVRLQVDESFLEAARVRAEVARSKYNNGLLSFDDWDAIENDLITREKSFLTSKRDRVVAEAAWEQAQGKGALP